MFDQRYFLGATILDDNTSLKVAVLADNEGTREAYHQHRRFVKKCIRSYLRKVAKQETPTSPWFRLQEKETEIVEFKVSRNDSTISLFIEFQLQIPFVI